jgi:hypothetical protein
MYKVNYVTEVVKASRNENAILKFLKIINILAQIAIIVIIFQVFDLNNKIETCISDTEKVKKEIKEKRESNYISNIEKDWTMYYYKLKAVKEMLSNRTNYSLILKNFAEIIPENIHVSDIYVVGSSFGFNLEFLKEKQKIYDNNYKYADEVKPIFDNNIYFDNKHMEVIGTKQQKINGNIVDLLEIKIVCNIRK